MDEEIDDRTVTLGGNQRYSGPELRQWGPFELRERVGAGGFGEVYRAFDPALQREVAVKILLRRTEAEEAEEEDSAAILAAILREARAMARVSHPNLAPIYGVNTYDGRPGFWSEFVRGRTLSWLVNFNGPFGAQEAIHIGLDLCRALSAVHSAGLLHRDIKTGNAMREEGGRILLMDFGLTEASAKQTFRGGTPGYMAPELCDGQAATVRTDLYAMGVLLYNLLTAKYPLGEHWSLLEVRPDLQPALVRAVHRALENDPQKRFASAAEMAAALAEAGSASSASARKKAPSLNRRPIIFGIAAILAVAGAVFAWRLHSQEAGNVPASIQSRYEKVHDLVQHYYRPNALTTAIPELEAITRDDPAFAAGFSDLGRANFLQFSAMHDARYIEPAREASARAVALDSNLTAAHVTLGLLYTQTGKNDLASEELDKAFRTDRLNAETWAARGDLYLRQGRADEAEAAIRKAIDLAPADWRWPKQLADFYRRTSRYDLAVAADRESLRLAPDNGRAYNNLGIDLGALGKLSESEAALRQAVAIEPGYMEYTNLGLALRNSGDLTGAAEAFEKATALNPSDYRAWGMLAGAYQSRNEREKAVETYRKTIQLGEALLATRPREPSLLADIALMYAAIGDAEHALPLMRQAKALDPDNAEVLFMSGAAFEALHRRADALKEIGLALRRGYKLDAVERTPALADLRKDPGYIAMARSFR